MAIVSSNRFRAVLFLGILLLSGFLILFFTTSDPDSEYRSLVPLATHANGQQYIGSESCKACHAEIYKSHLETAHYRTSAPATTTSVKGNFETGQNTFPLNDSVLIKMTSKNRDLYQEIWNILEGKLICKSKMDITVGSGTKGQSYLSWEDNELFQLQTSYYTSTDSWAVSPGMYSEGPAAPRPANAKCLECHTTFAKATSLYGMGNSYDRSQILYGIDCERCHGPSLAHIQNHRDNPNLKIPSSILKHDTLTRQQKLDACALCHSGIRMDKKPAFIFLTGNNLNDFSISDKSVNNSEEIDVHGNQYELLRRSECFKQTPTMDCTTCHDPHKNQRGNSAYFNQKCKECHHNTAGKTQAFNGLHLGKGEDCIACHMPLRPSESMRIPSQEKGSQIPLQVRSHLIDVYLDKTFEDQKDRDRP